MSRREAGGFTDDEIALLQTFAAQAVIAIENARLFKELEARTQELARTVGELRALGEVPGGGTFAALPNAPTLTTDSPSPRATRMRDASEGSVRRVIE